MVKRVWAVLLVVLVGLLGGTGCERPAPRPDLLLLITADTLRADRLGAYGSTRGLTPQLDALAADGVVFTRAYAPASFTVPSVAALMTGRYPETLGIWNNESDCPIACRRSRVSSVPADGERRRSSATTYSGVPRASPRIRSVRRSIPPDRSCSSPARARRGGHHDRRAGGARCLCERGRPVLLWVHYQDPHGPYTPPESLRSRYLERERRVEGGTRLLPIRSGDRGMGGLPRYQVVDGQREVAFYRSGYDAEVRYLDDHVGRLLAGVRARGLGGRAVIVFAADHGEGLGEHDYWFAHGEYLTDPLVRVPLVVVAPGKRPARRDDVVSLVDVFPTLLRLLVDVPAEVGMSHDLFADTGRAEGGIAYLANLGGAAVERHGIVEGGYKYVVGATPDERDGRLYRVEDEANDVAARFPEVRRRLAARLTALRARLRSRYPSQQRPLSDVDRARFRALGYLGDK